MRLTINKNLHTKLETISGEAYATLEQKILNEGFREPIVVWGDTIVDGRTRYQICQKHSITFTTSSMDFKDEREARIWIIDNQRAKRNWTEFVEYEMLEEKKALLKETGSAKKTATLKRGNKSPDLSTSDKTESHNTRNEIAAELDWSTGKVAQADIVSKYADEETKAELRKGKKTIHEAYKKIKTENYRQSEAEKRDIAQVHIKNEDIQIFAADILDAPIKDNSIDVIITDPPYPRQFIDCWRKLAEFAVKKLKKNGVLIAASGHSYLPEVYKNMTIDGLEYYWTGCIYQPGVSANLNVKRLRTNWKPFLIYVKGEYTKTFQGSDVYISEYKDTAKGQEYHKWGQSFPVFQALVNDYSYPNEIVCDPFMGGGTTALACIDEETKKVTRHFIGIEIDEKQCNYAKDRIAKALGEKR